MERYIAASRLPSCVSGMAMAGILPGRFASASSVDSVLAMVRLTRLATAARSVPSAIWDGSSRTSRAPNRDCAMLNKYSGYDPRNVCTASSGLPTSSSRTPRLRNAVRKSKPASVASWKSSTMTSFGRSDVLASFTAAAASIMSCEASRRYWSRYASLMAWLYSARSAKASRHCTRSRSRRSSSVHAGKHVAQLVGEGVGGVVHHHARPVGDHEVGAQ